MEGGRWAIALHGGAGVISKSVSKERQESYIQALTEALGVGVGILETGGTALDATEAVVRYLEDCPLFNAGKGSVFTHKGTHEMDASIMDGRTLRAGAVCGVSTIKNPIALARLVMGTKHILLSGKGAEEFADLHTDKVERADPEYFFVQSRYDALMSALVEERVELDHSSAHAFASAPARVSAEPKVEEKGTVGCVALDIHGDLAAATSTGGMTNKNWGRVGDSPIIGAGTYANNKTCAVSGTGTGEEFIRHVVSHDVSCAMQYAGLSLQAAADQVVHMKLKPGDGGVIAVGKDGSIAMPFNSLGMFRAAADSHGMRVMKIWE